MSSNAYKLKEIPSPNSSMMPHAAPKCSVRIAQVASASTPSCTTAHSACAHSVTTSCTELRSLYRDESRTKMKERTLGRTARKAHTHLLSQELRLRRRTRYERRVYPAERNDSSNEEESCLPFRPRRLSLRVCRVQCRILRRV